MLFTEETINQIERIYTKNFDTRNILIEVNQGGDIEINGHTICDVTDLTNIIDYLYQYRTAIYEKTGIFF